MEPTGFVRTFLADETRRGRELRARVFFFEVFNVFRSFSEGVIDPLFVVLCCFGFLALYIVQSEDECEDLR